LAREIRDDVSFETSHNAWEGSSILVAGCRVKWLQQPQARANGR